jgi:hypothetical protein
MLWRMVPLVGCLPGDAETLCQFGDGGFVQLIIFEETLSSFRHGSTFPRYGFHLLLELSVTHVFGIFVTDVFEWFTILKDKQAMFLIPLQLAK